jgi:hypothetical protein
MRSSVGFVLALLFSAQTAWAGSFRVGASFEWSRSEVGTGISGLLKLELPLERLARPALPLPRLRFAQEVPATDAAEPRARPALVLGHRSLARGAVRAARRASSRDAARERLDGLSTRARVSAALPELVLRAARSTDQTLKLSPTATDAAVYDYTQTGGADLLFEARATWTLDRLVFADEELGVERLRLEHARSEAQLVDRVVALVFDWERARRVVAEPEAEPEARLKAEVDELEAQALLDVLTDGWFSAELERQRARRAAAPLPPPTPSKTQEGTSPSP